MRKEKLKGSLQIKTECSVSFVEGEGSICQGPISCQCIFELQYTIGNIFEWDQCTAKERSLSSWWDMGACAIRETRLLPRSDCRWDHFR